MLFHRYEKDGEEYVVRNTYIPVPRRGFNKRITLTTQDIAYILGLEIGTIRRYINNGRLPITGNGVKDFYTVLDYLKKRNRL